MHAFLSSLFLALPLAVPTVHAQDVTPIGTYPLKGKRAHCLKLAETSQGVFMTTRKSTEHQVYRFDAKAKTVYAGGVGAKGLQLFCAESTVFADKAPDAQWVSWGLDGEKRVRKVVFSKRKSAWLTGLCSVLEEGVLLVQEEQGKVLFGWVE